MKIFNNVFKIFKNKNDHPFIFSASSKDSNFYRANINDLHNGNTKELNMIFKFGRVVVKVETANDFYDKQIKVSFFYMQRIDGGVSDLFFIHFFMRHQIATELNDLINITIKQRQEQIACITKELRNDQYYRKAHGRGLND